MVRDVHDVRTVSCWEETKESDLRCVSADRNAWWPSNRLSFLALMASTCVVPLLPPSQTFILPSSPAQNTAFSGKSHLWVSFFTSHGVPLGISLSSPLSTHR